MKTLSTYNAYHLGDNLLHLHVLRKLALAHPEITFTHTCDARHFAQLSPLLLGLPANNLQLGSAPAPRCAINSWRGAEGWFYRQPDQHDFLQIHLRWFRLLAEKMASATGMRLESPITCARDMLFDYPALQRIHDLTAETIAYDANIKKILVVNSPPLSGQWGGFSLEGFDEIIRQLDAAGHAVVTTHPSMVDDIPCTRAKGLDVTSIGRMSQRAHTILGCVTGPMWVTNSVFNSPETLRIHLLDSERVELTPNTVHTNSLSLVPEILRDRGLL